MTNIEERSAPAGGSDTDLVKAAAGGDEEAFADLYRRHAQTGWRLAHAVALSPADAESSLAEGFVRALRGVRRHRVPATEPFRPVLLAGVYLAATERLAAPGQPVASTAAAPGADPLTSAAFRSLPDRWRAALWLAEVEGMTPQRIAPVMAVSAAVGTQLVTRGRRGLADRFRQAGSPLPDPLPPALRALAPPLPSSLAASTLAAWQAAGAGDSGYRLAPAYAWLNERATRPLGVAVGGILALGLIGLGVVGQRGDLERFGPAALGSGPAAAGTIRVRSAGATESLRPTGAGGDSLLLGQGGPAPSPTYITLGSTDTFGSVSATGLPTGDATRATAAAGTAAPAAKHATAATTTAAPTTTAPATTTSGGSGGTSSPATTSPPTPTTVPTTTTTTPLAPVTTLVTTNGRGVQVNLGPLGGVSVGGTTTTTTKTKATTAPASTTTTTCAVSLPTNGLLNLKLLCSS